MIFQNLNDEQIVAVKADGHLLLTACPGSGKTRVITRKVAWELQNLSHPKRRIVALTFTIRAAEEIERRMRHMNVDTSQLWTGNIHAFCLNWILRPYACFHPCTQKGFTIVDSVKADEIMSEIVKKHNLSKNDKYKVRFKFNPDGTVTAPNQAIKAVLNEYHDSLINNRFVDFECLLYYSFELLERHPKTAENLSSIFQTILVDEYQDTQELQYQIIFNIVKAGKGRTDVCFVGDYDQAIYGSLGGVAKTKEEIEAGIGQEMQQLSLPGNYRTCQRVIDYYRHFQTAPIPIEARGENAGERGIVTLDTDTSKDNLPEAVARLITQSLEMGIPEKEICVLVPQWYLVMSLAKKLRALLPDVSFDATGISPMSGNRDNIFFKLTKLFMTEPSPRIYSLRYRWAREVSEELIFLTDNEKDAERYAPKKLLRTINGIKSGEENAIDYLTDCFSQFFDKLELEINLIPPLEINYESYFKGIKRRIDDPNYALPGDIQSFRNFYKDAKGVVVSSCHGVKGEEFETVISFGLLEGHLPHWGEIFDPDSDEDEVARKLLYVICSRAKTNLHLIAETGRKRGWEDISLEPTPHLLEIEFDYD
ncbi:MAG: ATP-dependent helicase [Lewinellaceae bacterium]|nr:ATP-dependent helicase [Saprospiraceae bacterium]MCB9341777.1 ATP-dependent helicase [Lewinellaceae bacterium]